MDAEIGFEANLKKLEKVVRALESGELGLDAALANYEDGVRMLADCHQMLDAAGKKVALLTGATDESGEPETAPFDATATIESPTRPGKAAKARPKSEGIEDLPY